MDRDGPLLEAIHVGAFEERTCRKVHVAVDTFHGGS